MSNIIDISKNIKEKDLLDSCEKHNVSHFISKNGSLLIAINGIDSKHKDIINKVKLMNYILSDGKPIKIGAEINIEEM